MYKTTITNTTILTIENQMLHNANQKQKHKQASEKIYINKRNIVFSKKIKITPKELASMKLWLN